VVLDGFPRQVKKAEPTEEEGGGIQEGGGGRGGLDRFCISSEGSRLLVEGEEMAGG